MHLNKGKMLLFAVMAGSSQLALAEHAQVPPIYNFDPAKVETLQSPDSLKRNFSDIQYYVGQGSDVVGVIIDFNDGTLTDSYLWGVRYDPPATAEDIYRTLVSLDYRLRWFESESGSFGVSVYGFGYDSDDDGATFDYGGVLSPPASGPWTSAGADDPSSGPLDVDDQYASGWLSGDYWGFLTSTDEGANWTPAATGISGYTVNDQDWIALSFGGFPSPVPSGWTAATPTNQVLSVETWELYQ